MRPLLLAAAFALLGLAWAVANPPYASPDESAHVLRAVGVAQGELVGPRTTDPNPALFPAQRRWVDQAATLVPVPAGLLPAAITPCMSGRPQQSAGCLRGPQPTNAREVEAVTSVGTYQPLPYLLAAPVVTRASSADGADRAARLVTLAVAAALLTAAVLLLWDATAGARSLLGLAVAVTPQALFVAGSFNGSALEVAAACAFAAALLRLGRDAPAPPRAAWVAAGAAGATLALSRSASPVFVVVLAALCAAFAGRAALAGLWRERRRALLLAAGPVVAAMGLNRAWEAAHGPEVTTTLVPSWENWMGGRRQWAGAADELVGHFGFLDARLPEAGLLAWALAAALLVGTALRRAGRRERVVLLAAGAVAVVGPMYLFAAVTRHTGFGLQGRHVLPVVLVVPLLAGEVVRRAGAPVRLVAGLGIVVAAVQALAWWANARRYAVGTEGPWWFLGRDDWAPPAGWLPWALLALLGAAAMAAALAPRPVRRA